MIIKDSAKIRDTIADNLVLKTVYRPLSHESMVIQHFSPAAQCAFHELCPGETGRYISPYRPEVIALRLLDFLSSKQGYIRRKGQSCRTKSFYLQTIPVMAQAIKERRPITLDSLCLCTTLANMKYAGESPYPHMAAYIAFENLHKIVKGASEIYTPGIRLILGYEGTLLRSLYFHNETVVQESLDILRELNEIAYRRVIGDASSNPIEVVDAIWMIERTFGTFSRFLSEVENYKLHIPDDSVAEWRRWYGETVSSYYFPSEATREKFITERAKWRAAVCHLKYHGGVLGKGFIHFDNSVLPFTPSGRRANMLALQLVPRSSYLPHQRIIVYDGETGRWAMRAYEDIQQDKACYAPRYVRQYLYPFYFKKLPLG